VSIQAGSAPDGLRAWAARALLSRLMLLAGSLGLSLLLAAPAAAEVAVPALRGHVTDLTGTLDAGQRARLEQSLAAFEASRGSQLAVLIVPTTAPETVEAYALRVAEQWKLGRKKIDDGAILVVAKDDRALRIEVGYGLEGALTDITSHRIIDETIVPRFKAQDFAGGIAAGVAQMISVASGEELPAPPQRHAARGRDGFGSYMPVLFIVALGVGGILRALFGKLPGAVITGGIVAGLAWFFVGALSIALLSGVAALVVTLIGGAGLLGRGLGGYYGGGRGGGGGGFSGGGGGFGGGGASGKW